MQEAHAIFESRHIGPSKDDQRQMLAELGASSLEDLAAQIVPADILLPPEEALVGLPEPCSEAQALAELAAIASHNQVVRSLIGHGYYGTATPAVGATSSSRTAGAVGSPWEGRTSCRRS